MWGQKKKGPVQLKSTDGMETLSDTKRVVARWSEHFQKLLDVPGNINHEALDNIPQRITKTSLDESPTMDEMVRTIAIARLCTGPTLFSIFLSAMLDDAFRDMGDGVYIQSRQSADLFNFAHFRAKTKTTRILMGDLIFADDSALVAHSAEEMQKILDAFSNASKKLGLKFNIKKTEVLYQPNSTRTREEDIMVDGNKLNSVLEFTYLGSTI